MLRAVAIAAILYTTARARAAPSVERTIKEIDLAEKRSLLLDLVARPVDTRWAT